MKSGKVFLGILAGASAGALLGILFAPHTGQETRNRIAKTTKKYAETVKEKFDETLDDITEKFNKVKEEVSEYAQHTRVKEEKLKKDNEVEIG